MPNFMISSQSAHYIDLFHRLKAKKLTQEQSLNCEDYLDHEDDSRVDEEVIVHQAVGILRKRMSMTSKLEGEYFSPAETSLEEQRNFLDPLLYKAVGWIMDGKKHETGDDIETNARLLSIACDITTLS